MSSDTKHSNTFRIWVRIVAGLLAVFFAVFMVLIDMTRVKLSTDTGSDIDNAAAGLLAENTDYVNKTGFERVEDVISNLFTNPETFDNYYKLASMQIGQGKYEKALVSVDRCLHEYKGTLSSVLDDLYMKKACLETLLGDYDAALGSFGRISSGSRESYSMLRIQAQIFIERGSSKTQRAPFWNTSANSRTTWKRGRYWLRFTTFPASFLLVSCSIKG